MTNPKKDLITIKNLFYSPYKYTLALLKWLIISAIIGIVGGVIGSVFHLSIDYVTEFRGTHWWIILLLPVGGSIITALYAAFHKKGEISTNRVIEAVREDTPVPLVMAPLIFISTCITHLLGGSAGREGAALQLGGSIGYNLGKIFRLNKEDSHTAVMTGMSALFAALFGTPLTAAFFALEVTSVGVLHYSALVPCIAASTIAFKIAGVFGLHPVRFHTIPSQIITSPLMVKVIILTILCAIVSILFCTSIKTTKRYMNQLLPNKYIRTVAGSILIIGLTFALGTFDYNGAGMDIITNAMNGEARYEAFVLKIIFTALTIAAGFKGGEIVPTFFIGSTFGCIMGSLLGIAPEFGSAIGFVALFCGVVNCPIASTFLALEVFGADSILIMATVCGISYMMSGYFGLYKSQKIVYSKLSEDLIDKSTK